MKAKRMDPVVLFRPTRETEEEMWIASKYFPVYTQRSAVPKHSLVIGRYSVLPFYKELETDLEICGSQLINSYRQHRGVADISSWYMEFDDITPKTWFELHEIPKVGPFVLKGETNSKKYQWKTHMFAENKEQAGQVYSNLSKDGLIGSQRIVIRQYVPLRRLDTDVCGLPITEEYRLFFYKGQLVTGAFYWSSHSELLEQHKDLGIQQIPTSFIREVGVRSAEIADFVVVDVARTDEGGWIVVELNDGQMSGLSECDPDELYKNLKNLMIAQDT